MSLASAIQEGKYIISLLSEVLGQNQMGFELFCDNQGAIALAKNPIKHQRSKHIDIRYHFIRDEILNHNLTVHYVASENNMADVFTKPMPRIKFDKFKTALFG